MGDWIVVLIVLALAGSVFWIMPSQQDRKKMGLRQVAMRSGLKVRFPDKGLKERLVRYEDILLGTAMYERILPARQKSMVTGALFIVREDAEREWVFLEKNLQLALQAVSEQVVQALMKLPKNIGLVMLSPNGISVFWSERGEERDVELMLDIMDEVNLLTSSAC